MLAWYRGSKATNEIFTFTPSKISFPSPENFLSDRAEHRARQINCATKNKNPIRGFFPAQPQLKVRLTILFWKEYYFHYYYFEKSTLFTTNILKTVLLLFWILQFLLFWKEFPPKIFQTSTILKIATLLPKALSQLKIMAIFTIKYSSLATIYKYNYDYGLSHPTLHFPNMHAFLNYENRPVSSDSTASFLISKTSSGVDDSTKIIHLLTKESIASSSSKSVDVTGINMDDNETNSGSIASDVYDFYNVPEGIFYNQHNGRHWVHKTYQKLKTPLK